MLGSIVDDARKTAATQGRGGKGVIIVWAAGNGAFCKKSYLFTD